MKRLQGTVAVRLVGWEQWMMNPVSPVSPGTGLRYMNGDNVDL